MSSACGGAARAMSGNHPGSRSYLDLGAEVRFGVHQRIDVTEAVVAVLTQLRRVQLEKGPHVAEKRLVERLRRGVGIRARAAFGLWHDLLEHAHGEGLSRGELQLLRGLGPARVVAPDDRSRRLRRRDRIDRALE